VKNEFSVNENDLRKLNQKLGKLFAIDKSVASNLIDRFAIKSEYDIVKDAPVDTGNLRSQVHKKTNDKEALIESQAFSKLNPTFDYALIQEFGSSRRKPKPYFWNNIYKNYNVLLLRIDKAIKKAIK